MSWARSLGAALVGVDGLVVEVEVRISSQLPRVDVVGLPEAAVRESSARVRAAMGAVGERFPPRRVTVNLAPAGLRKSGAGLDLPIAMGILAASSAIGAECIEEMAFLGELALDARLRPVRGSLAMALALRAAGCRSLVVPVANAVEAALAPGLEVRAARNLAEILAHLRGAQPLPRQPATPLAEPEAAGPCLSEVRGQEAAKRALEIAAAGGHALLLAGPPGTGKTMLARRLPGLLPPLDRSEALEVARIHGAAGRLEPGQVLRAGRPFRAPHHGASVAGLLGGGQPPRPGELSLAHRGVLFLDELPELDRRCLESLRQVLEERRVCLARARQTLTFPADFQLVAACNPCPCGWYGCPDRDCRCDTAALARYRRRLSGPLLDRIDLHVTLAPVAWRDLSDESACNVRTSEQVRGEVERARQLQRQRGVPCNAALPDRQLETAVLLHPEARTLLGRAVDHLGLSARAARRVLRVARSVADLDGELRIAPRAMAEAIGYRGATRGV